MARVFANGRSILHAGDGDTHVAIAPDVCKTPSPGGPIPVPYVNSAQSSDLVKGTRTVLITGKSVATKVAALSTSTGDEPGSAGGVISSKTKGKMTWSSGSPDVKFEGHAVVRFLDVSLNNGNANNTGGINKGDKFKYPGTPDAQKIYCDNCDKLIDDPSHVQLEASAESIKAANEALESAAKKSKGKKQTVTGLVVSCGDRSRVFKAVAGDTSHRFNTDTFSRLARNFVSRKAIAVKRDTDQGREAGNCAEQKALYDAFRWGYSPLQCTANMSTARMGFWGHVPACAACKRIITSMICTNEPTAARPEQPLKPGKKNKNKTKNKNKNKKKKKKKK